MKYFQIIFIDLLIVLFVERIVGLNCPNGFVAYNNACVQWSKDCPTNFIWQAGVCLEAPTNVVNVPNSAPNYGSKIVVQTSNSMPFIPLPPSYNIQPAVPCSNNQLCAPILLYYAQTTPCINTQPCNYNTVVTPRIPCPAKPSGANTTPRVPFQPCSKQTDPITERPTPKTCPPGTVLIDNFCRLIGCGKGFIYKDNNCVRVECPTGTAWTGKECFEPQPKMFNISFNNTVITQINRTEPALVIENVNNFNVTVANNGQQSDCNDDYCESDEIPENHETNFKTSNTDCCVVITPRLCKPRVEGERKSWSCYSRRYRRCGSFCIAPTIYLKPPEPLERNGQILMPPTTNGLIQQPNGNTDLGAYDCSGCIAGQLDSCSPYCQRIVCPPLRCSFYDQRQYCKECPGENGCRERDGCFSDWCADGSLIY